MEKFNLKWNDFLLNVSKSFGILRKEEDFLDVSLVCDDEQIFSAHKVVLSASSDFFKTILRKADHSKPMVYLNGVSAKEIHNILDYIYEGEVQLFQDELDAFLAVAEKLKINGLVGGKSEHVYVEEDENEEIKTFNKEIFKFPQERQTAEREGFQEGEENDKVAVRKSNKTIAMIGQAGDNNVYDEAKRAVDELVMKVEDGSYDFFGSQYVQRYTSQLIMYVLYTEIGHSVRLRV